MECTDEALALAAAGGDGAAFALLLERRYDGLFALAYRLTGSKAEAEDLTQDICAALPGKLGGYRAEAKVTTWLYRIVVNAAHDRRRREATRQRAAQGWGEMEVGRRADDAEAARQRDWLSRAMGSLSDDLRDTLALLVEDDMTHAEAADVLGISEGTVSWRVSEAKKRLKTIADEDMR